MPKLATVTARTQASIRSQISYMRAGPTLRTNRSFRAEVATLPLGSLKTVQYVLESQSIEQIYAAGEADPVIAELAIKRNAWIVSQDSDFLITNHGSKGYIPLDSLMLSYQEDSTPALPGDTEDDGDWLPVKKGKASRPSTPTPGSRNAPVRTAASTVDTISESTQASFKVYTSTALALFFKIRVAMLPLLAVLLGNDHHAPMIYKSSAGTSNGISASASRIDSISQALRKYWPAFEKKQDVQSLREYLLKVINEVREFAVSEGEMASMAEKCLLSLQQYVTSALPSLAPIPVEATSSALQVFIPSSDEARKESNAQIKIRLLNAYETGKLSREMLQVLCSGIYMRQACLEDPDQQSCTISCGREIRQWVWALLQESIGIYHREKHYKEETDEDEGSVRSDHEDDDPQEAQEPTSQAAPVVVEYVRRSATLSAEEVAISEMSALLPRDLVSNTPVLARSTSDRYQIFLYATSSVTEGFRSLSGPHIPLIGVICAVRHLTKTFEDSKLQAWTAQIRRAALSTAFLVANECIPNIEAQEAPSNVAIQRSAQFVSALNAVRLLSEALLLTPIVEGPERLFEGSLFHHLLEVDNKGIQDALATEKVNLQEFEQCLALLEQGLPKETEPGRERVDKSQRKKTKDQMQKNTANMAAFSAFGNSKKPKNPFEMLAVV